MLSVVGLDAALRARISETLPDDILPTAHPIWAEVLTRLGEHVDGLAALDDGRVAGWLNYTLMDREGIRVASSLPYLAYAGLYSSRSDVTRALLERYRRTDADVVSLGTSPLLDVAEEEGWRAAFAPSHSFENFVQMQELTDHPRTRLPRKRRETFAAHLRRAKSFGLRVIRSLAPDQLAEWLDIYRTRYATIGATPYPDEFHRALYELAVPAGAAEIWGVLDDDSQLLGAVVFLISRREVTYFSSAFRDDSRNTYPTTFLLDEAFRSFIEREVPRFNWQSSPGRGGVFEYKKRWGAMEHRHFYFSSLLNPASNLLAMQPDAVRATFPLRFVLPYSAWATIDRDAR